MYSRVLITANLKNNQVKTMDQMKNIEYQILTIDKNQGRKVNIAGGEYRIIISGEHTGGSFAIIEMAVPPGAGPVPHSHPSISETFHVLDGELSFRSEKGRFLAQKGSTVSIPKGGLIHSFKNLTDKPAKLLCTVIPAGLDDFFIEVADFMTSVKENPLQSSDLENKKILNQLSEKYGQTLFEPDYLDL